LLWWRRAHRLRDEGSVRLNRELLLAMSLALSFIPAGAHAAARQPPAEYAVYIAAMRKADAITDPLQRCLAYPDLPGNTWPAGAAKARCTMFLTPVRYTLDQIDATLEKPGGAAELESAFNALLDAHFKEPAQREQLSVGLRVFRGNDLDKAERIARAWRAAAPDSAFARVALGHVLSRRGWDARGGDYASRTAPEKLKKMGEYFVKAAKEYQAALEGTSRLLPACEGLMAIGRNISDNLQTYATERCLYIDPTSYYVVDELMNAAEPRWGGSEDGMKRVAAYAQEKAAINPVLSVFASNDAYYRISRMADGDAESIAVLEPAALQVPNAAYLRLVGGAYLRRDDAWKALAYLSQALRFMPDYAQESRFRALVLRHLGESKWARADAERAARLDPGNGHAHELLGAIVRELEGPAAAAPHFKRAMDDKKTRGKRLQRLLRQPARCQAARRGGHVRRRPAGRLSGESGGMAAAVDGDRVRRARLDGGDGALPRPQRSQALALPRGYRQSRPQDAGRAQGHGIARGSVRRAGDARRTAGAYSGRHCLLRAAQVADPEFHECNDGHLPVRDEARHPDQVHRGHGCASQRACRQRGGATRQCVDQLHRQAGRHHLETAIAAGGRQWRGGLSDGDRHGDQAVSRRPACALPATAVRGAQDKRHPKPDTRRACRASAAVMTSALPATWRALRARVRPV
jgi:tetratricopeptide (TPR) repeat protein